MEVRLKASLLDTQKAEEQLNKNSEKKSLKESMQLQSFREENETLKRQMFSIDK